jgi:hypothetical protein
MSREASFYLIGGLLIGLILGSFFVDLMVVINTIRNTTPAVAMASLGVVIGWIFAFFIFILELLFLWFIWIGTNGITWQTNQATRVPERIGINIAKLISDENGDASLSRFQLLIFTFVISMSLLLIIVSAKDGPAFPAIPPEILGLLGISGGTYAIAKGIQANRDTELKEAEVKKYEIEAKHDLSLTTLRQMPANSDGANDTRAAKVTNGQNKPTEPEPC